MKQKREFKSIVAETLFIPLYMRAKESRRVNPILNDKAAEQLADNLEYDYSQFDGAKLSEVGCVVRGWYFDRAVKQFIDTHPRPVVVNVGCGRKCGLRIGYPFPAHRQQESGLLRLGLAGSHYATSGVDTRTAGQCLYRSFIAGNRLDG